MMVNKTEARGRAGKEGKEEKDSSTDCDKTGEER